MKFWQKPAGFSAKISFRHSFESVSCFSDKMKDAHPKAEKDAPELNFFYSCETR
ncbi:MAG: hypothetical protein GY795_50665 [Desulfobacterales bacterium]|nr:hypothetical protein [Desulfobacterales bacterium]